MDLATAVGRPVKVDTNTLDVNRASFSRVVEINLEKPVVGKVWLREYWFKVEYEGLYRICATCGCYGHLAKECSTPQKSPSIRAPVTINGDMAARTPAMMAATNVANIQGNRDGFPESFEPNQHEIPSDLNAYNNDELLHGDWLVVKRKSHNKTNKGQAGLTKRADSEIHDNNLQPRNNMREAAPNFAA